MNPQDFFNFIQAVWQQFLADPIGIVLLAMGFLIYLVRSCYRIISTCILWILAGGLAYLLFQSHISLVLSVIGLGGIAYELYQTRRAIDDYHGTPYHEREEEK